jgi:hypothetical protein
MRQMEWVPTANRNCAHAKRAEPLWTYTYFSYVGSYEFWQGSARESRTDPACVEIITPFSLSVLGQAEVEAETATKKHIDPIEFRSRQVKSSKRAAYYLNRKYVR